MVTDVYAPSYLDYHFGPQHPFNPVRLEMLLDLLGELGCEVRPLEPQPATRDDLLSVHSAAYVDAVEAAARGEAVADVDAVGLGTADNPIFPGMDRAAASLVGGTLLGAKLIHDGRADLVLQLGGGLHHAQPDHASGFCIYNDLAVAIRYLVGQGHTVAYIDIDVHHGDGVQAILDDDPSVLTISFHESGQYLFPGTGDTWELGRGQGRGLKLNVPLEPFTEGDSYLKAFDAVAPKAMSVVRPDVTVVQAGADAHFADPLADLLLTTRDFEALFRRLVEVGRTYSKGRMLFTLGGGYDVGSVPRVWALLYHVLHELPIPETLPEAWCERWEQRLGVGLPRRLHDPNPGHPPVPRKDEIANHNRHVVERLLDELMPYWYMAM